MTADRARIDNATMAGYCPDAILRGSRSLTGRGWNRRSTNSGVAGDINVAWTNVCKPGRTPNHFSVPWTRPGRQCGQRIRQSRFFLVVRLRNEVRAGKRRRLCETLISGFRERRQFPNIPVITPGHRTDGKSA
jgi:hypothetical protein